MTGRRARAEYLAVTRKFARRFVMVANRNNRNQPSLCGGGAETQAALASPAKAQILGENRMKTFVAFRGSALIVAASVQFAAAAQRYHSGGYSAPAGH